MATIRSTTKEQLRTIIDQVLEAGRGASDLRAGRRLQQAAALLDAAAEMLDLAERHEVPELP